MAMSSVFVTFGSQKFQFDRLLREIDRLAGMGEIDGPVFAQTGACAYVPEHIEWKPFLDRDEFGKRMGEADLVITHAGTGAIMGALRRGCKVIAVPRLARYGEHVDDHQVQLVREFDEMGLIEPCYEVSDLAEAYHRCLSKSYRRYQSNTAAIIADLERYLGIGGGGR